MAATFVALAFIITIMSIVILVGAWVFAIALIAWLSWCIFKVFVLENGHGKDSEETGEDRDEP